VIAAVPHGFARVAWLVLAMTMATLPFLGALPAWQTLALIALGTWRLVQEHRGLVVVPTLPVRLALVAITALLLFVTGNLGFGLTAATPLFVALLWSKLLELKARRDYLIACVLSYFLVAVLLFDRQSLFVCLYALATLAAITIALVSYHVDHGARRSLALGLRLVVQGLPVAAAVFVLFPRMQVHLPNLTGQAVSGFTDKLTPGDVARLALSDEPVMRVEFPDGDRPPLDQLYWRGLVLSETNGETWSVNPRPLRYDRPPVPSDPALPTVVQEITLQPLNQKWLFALDIPESAPQVTYLALNRSLVRQYVPTQPLRYRVTSRLGEIPNDGDGFARPLPALVDARLRTLAQEWRRDTSDPRVIAARGMQWFHEQGFTYSLAPGVMEAGAAEFLFDKRSGFCSHYATAYALVLRLAGVSTRVVVGFRGGVANPYGDFITVRFDHAHAWTEVHLRDGWHRFDPTVGIPPAPGESLPAALSAGGESAAQHQEGRGPWWLPDALLGPYTRINQWLAVVDARWETTVMAVDEERQSRWLSALGLPGLQTWAMITLLVLSVALMAGVWMWWTRLRPQRPRPDAVAMAWNEGCDRLAALGVVRLAHEGPRDFSERAAAALPELAGPIRSIADAYVALRYGPAGAASAEALVHLRRAVRHLPRRRRPRPPASAAAAGG
jgi:transglutaminase-like putative cysteine protease